MDKLDTPVTLFELREAAKGRLGYGDTRWHLHLLGLAADRIEALEKPASEPVEGYSQAYADQMRTALLRISAMIDGQGNLIEMHREELRGIAKVALLPPQP